MTPRRAFILLLITFVIGFHTVPMISAQQGNAGTDCVEVLSSFNGGALHTIVNVETGSARSFLGVVTPADPLANPVPDWLPLNVPPLSTLTVTVSPGSDYVVAFYPYSDFAVDFHVYRADDHAEVFQASVGLIETSITGRYAWLNDHQLMISEMTADLLDNAVLVDLADGTSRLIREDVRAWALSPDSHQLAVQPRLNPGDNTELYLYDLSVDTNRLISVPFGLRDFVWLTNEQLVGIDDAANVYTLTNSTWQPIAAVNGDAFTVHRSPCQPPELEMQQCRRVGFATEATREYFELANGARIPIQMPPDPIIGVQETGAYRLVQIRKTPETSEYALSLENTSSGESVLIDDAVSDLIMPTLALSPDGTSIAAAFDSPNTRVQVFNDAVDLVMIADFEVQPDENAMVWSPSGHYLAVTALGSGLDTVTLFEQGVGVTMLQTGTQAYRRLVWSPDESYLVVYGTYDDFSAEMSIFTTHSGAEVLATQIVDSFDDAGNAIYGWLDNHTLIVQSDGTLSSIDLRAATAQPQPLTGAAMVQEPCTEGDG